MRNFKSADINRQFSLLSLICLALLVITSQISGAERIKTRCSADREYQMDECALKMGFFGDHAFRVPKNSTAMAGFCSTLKDSIGCIQAYSRDCLQGFTKQLLTSLLKRGKQQYSLICRDNESKKDFINKMSCLTDDKIEQFHLNMDASIGRFEFIASDKVKSDARLPSMCCSYQIFNRDLDNSLSRICGKPANRKGSTNEYIQKIVGGTAGEFFGLICDNHRSIEECRASKKTNTVVPRLEDVTTKVIQGKLRTKNKSLIPVLLEILDTSSTD